MKEKNECKGFGEVPIEKNIYGEAIIKSCPNTSISNSSLLELFPHKACCKRGAPEPGIIRSPFFCFRHMAY
jgi:hypothetical protein